MLKSLTLRALVKERLSAAADDVFTLFEKTLCEYEEELSRCREENKRLLDFLCPKVVPVRGGGLQSVTQDITEVPGVNGQPEEEEVVKYEEEQLPVCAPETSVLCVKVEKAEESSFQKQHEHHAPITEKPHAHPQTENPTEHLSDSDNDNNWGARLISAATQMETATEGDLCSPSQSTVAQTSSRQTFMENEHLQSYSLANAEDRPYSCSLCSKRYKQAPSLSIHMRTHTGARPYSCSICDKTFKYAPSLKTHMRKHTGEKPYSCNFCDKTFAQTAHLQTHIRTHTGEAPYSCPFCGKAFTQTSNLKKHMRTHTKTYFCPLCHKDCVSTRNLKRHIAGHGEQGAQAGQANL